MSNKPEDNLDDVLAEADRLAAEAEAELQQNIGDMDVVGIDQLTPEMLENMDPAQLQSLMAQMAAARPSRREQSYYTRKRTPKAVKRQRRLAQKAARKVSIRNGAGRTISRRKRLKKAA